LRQVIEYATQLAEALAAAHAARVVHRDVKPGNIQITPSGVLKLLDLGIAKMTQLDDDLTTHREVLTGGGAGTPGYMSPEQRQGGAVGPHSDVYSAGVVIMEMLTAVTPFPAASLIAASQHRGQVTAEDVRRFAPSMPLGLATIVAKCLAVDVTARLRDGVELRNALALLPTEESTRPIPLPPPPRRTRKAVLAVAAMSILIAILAATIWTRRPQPGIPAPVSAPSAATTITLLPLMNLTADRQTGELAVAMASQLVHNLGSLPNTRVSVGTAAEIPPNVTTEVTRPQSTTYALGVSLEHQKGDELRLHSKLLGASGAELWRASYDGDILAVHRAMLRDFAPVLQRHVPGLTVAGSDHFYEVPTDSLEAFKLYANARGLLATPNVAGQLDGAVGMLERAVDLDGRFGLALAGLADAYRAKHQASRDNIWIEKARTVAEEAVARHPTLAAAHYSLGSVRNTMGQTEEAIRSLRTAIALEPSHEEAHRVLGRALASQGHVDEGIAELREAVKIRPDSWSSQYAIAYVYYMAGRYDEAVPHLRRVTELQPAFGAAFTLLGAIHQRRGELPQAIGYYEHAARVSDDAPAYNNLGTLYFAAGRYQLSLDAFLKAVALDPTSAVTRRNAGDAYARLGAKREAGDMYRTAIDLLHKRIALNAGDASSISLLGLCEAKIGRFEDAAKHTAQAVVLRPDDREVLYRQAAVSALAGDRAGALATLRRAIDRGYERRLARSDEDFKSLRNTTEFRALTADK
jgi:tetratricopeptide (TPR) repeat protein